MQKIIICSQIKNRLHQFKQTFEHNIDVINKYNNVIWNIIDIHSIDGFKNFIKPYISTKINYYECLTNIEYSIPIAKNFTVRLSEKDSYVFNLDVDNFLGSIIDSIINSNYGNIYCKEKRTGVHGRIGCYREIFKKIRGYDESFYPAGFHEIDFRRRCKKVGYKFIQINNDIPAILNTKDDTIANCNKNKSWSEMNKINKTYAYDYPDRVINTKFQACNFLHNLYSEIQLSNDFDWIGLRKV